MKNKVLFYDKKMEVFSFADNISVLLCCFFFRVERNGNLKYMKIYFHSNKHGKKVVWQSQMKCL